MQIQLDCQTFVSFVTFQYVLFIRLDRSISIQPLSRNKLFSNTRNKKRHPLMKHFGCDVNEERVQACGAKRMGKVGPRRNHKEFTRGVSPTVAGQRTCTGFVYRTTKFCPLPRIVTRKGRACGAFTFPPTVPLKKKTELLCMPADRSPRSKIQ